MIFIVNRKDFRPNNNSYKISEKDREKIRHEHIRKYNEWNREDNRYRKVETSQAINERGYTKNSKEGGYIMPNGEMLDFSGRNNATGYYHRKPKKGQPDYLANNRNSDHREVAQYINKDNDEDRSNPTDNIRTFSKETGAIRMNDSGDLYLEIYEKPTYQQKLTIQRIKHKQGIIIVDRHYNGKLESKEYKTYEEFAKDN